MRRISDQSRKNVIASYLNGMTYDEIAASLGVSKGAISGIVDEVRQGRSPDFENVAVHVEAVRELTAELRKLGIGPVEADAGIGVFRRLQELGVEPAEYQNLVLILRKIAPDGAAIGEFVPAALELARIDKETGMGFKEAAAQRNALKEDLDCLRGDIKTNEEEEERLSKGLDSLEQEMDGLDAGIAKSKSVLSKIEADVRKLDSRKGQLAEEVGGLTEQKKVLEQSIANLRTHEEEARKSISAVESSLGERMHLASDLTEVGFGVMAMKRLKSLLAAVADKRGVSDQDAVARFFADLETYDSVAGFADEVEALKNDKDRLVSEIEQLSAGAAPVSEMSKYVSLLKKNNIAPEVISGLASALEDSGFEPDEVMQGFRTWAELVAAADDAQQRVDNLAAKSLSLEDHIASLQKQRNSLASAIRAVEEEARGGVMQVMGEFVKETRAWADQQARVAVHAPVLRLAEVLWSGDAEAVSLLDVSVAVDLAMCLDTWCRVNMKDRKIKSIEDGDDRFYGMYSQTEANASQLLAWLLKGLIQYKREVENAVLQKAVR